MENKVKKGANILLALTVVMALVLPTLTRASGEYDFYTGKSQEELAIYRRIERLSTDNSKVTASSALEMKGLVEYKPIIKKNYDTEVLLKVARDYRNKEGVTDSELSYVGIVEEEIDRRYQEIISLLNGRNENKDEYEKEIEELGIPETDFEKKLINKLTKEMNKRYPPETTESNVSMEKQKETEAIIIGVLGVVVITVVTRAMDMETTGHVGKSDDVKKRGK